MRVGKSTLPLIAKTKKQIMELVKQYGTGEHFCRKCVSSPRSAISLEMMIFSRFS